MFPQKGKKSQDPELVLKQHKNSAPKSYDFDKARNVEISSILLLRHKYAEKEVRKHHLTFSSLSTALMHCQPNDLHGKTFTVS